MWGASVKDELRKRLDPVRCRLQRRRMLVYGAKGVLVAALVGLAIGGVRCLLPSLVPADVAMGLLAACPLIAVVLAALRKENWREAARAVDEYYDLKDRSSTAVALADDTLDAPIRRMQVRDAVGHLQQVVPRDVVPITVPKGMFKSMGWLAIAVVLLICPLPTGLGAGDGVPRDGSRVDDDTKMRPLPEVSPQLAQTSSRAARKLDPGECDRVAEPSTLDYRRIIRDYFQSTHVRAGANSVTQEGEIDP